MADKRISKGFDKKKANENISLNKDKQKQMSIYNKDVDDLVRTPYERYGSSPQK